jgi:6-phosphogluconolactonase
MLAPTVPHQRLTMSRALLATATPSCCRFPAVEIDHPERRAGRRRCCCHADSRVFATPLEIYWCP